MIPRLGDGNIHDIQCNANSFSHRLENDSPSRGRKQVIDDTQNDTTAVGLENDSPSRGRKLKISNAKRTPP